jgi:hypothetical protein
LAALALLAAVAAQPAVAQALVVEIGRAGEVTAVEAGDPQPPRPGNIAGSNSVLDPRFTHLGPDVQGVFCKQFGFEFRAKNLAPSSQAIVQVTLDHPLWTRPDGVSGTREVNLSVLTGNEWSYVGYTLEENWSLVPGPWVFTISQGPRVLATATFNVSVENPNQHMPSEGCNPPTA